MSVVTSPPVVTTPARVRPRPGHRSLLAVAAAVGLVVCSAAGASAHVRVLPDSTTAGGFTQLTFRVPTESETAGTVGVRVELPTDTPLTSVRTKPLPGWTAVVERGELPEPVDAGGVTLTEAPLAVVWTADPGTQVGPGEYQEFALSVGPLPEAGTQVLLPATQTYSDGEVVEWAEAPSADGSEPELPAPVLVTTAAEDGGHAHGGGATGTQTDAATATGANTEAAALTTPTPSPEATEDGTARLMGAGGLLLGVVGLVLGIAATRRANARVR